MDTQEGPYLSRFGTTEIKTNPESTQVSIEQAIEAEAIILNLPVDSANPECTIGEILQNMGLVIDDKQAPPVYLNYFLDNSGSVISDNSGFSIEIPVFNSKDEVLNWLSKLAIVNTDSKILLLLAKKSQEGFISSVTEWYKNGTPKSERPDEDLRLVNIDPVNSIIQLRDLLSAKKALRAFYIDNKHSAPEEIKVFEAIYASKINGLLADQLPRMRAIIEQAQLQPDAYAELILELEEILPRGFLKTFVTIENQDRMQTLFHRLDYVRNGFVDNANVNSSVVDDSLLEVDTVSKQYDTKPFFDTNEIEMIKDIEVTPDMAKQIIEKLLDHYGLSQKGWSCRFNSTKSTYQVSAKNHIFEITTDTRSLRNSIVVGFVHEFTHVFQAINDEAFPYQIGKIKGKRSSGIREAGAISNERTAQAILFGEHISGVNLTYANALMALEHGGSVLDAVEAFVSAKDKNMPPSAATAKIAADRLLRLVRKGFNSQPMVYAESDILQSRLEQFNSQLPGVGTGITSLDLPDQMRLQAIGALPKPESNFDINEHLSVVLDIASTIIPELKAILNAKNKVES